MLGKFTPDHIEQEFGKLQQGSGETHFITVQHVLEKVAISKTKLLLPLDPNSEVFQAGYQCEKCGFLLTE